MEGGDRFLHPIVQDWQTSSHHTESSTCSLCSAVGDSNHFGLNEVWPPDMALSANQLLGYLVELMGVRLEGEGQEKRN